MAQTTSLVFNGGVIPSPAGSGKAKLLKIGETTITEQEVQVTKKVICDPDSVTTVAPFMEVLTSARLAELISANSILVLDDGTVQYLMADATVVDEDGTSVCTSVSFLGLSLEDRAKVLYPCTRITDELTLQQVIEVGEPVETGFDLVKAYPEDTEAGTLIDKLEIEDNSTDPDWQPMLEVVQGDHKVAINEDNLRETIGSLQTTVSNQGTAIGSLQTTVSNQGTAIGSLQNGKKDKQQPKSFNGSATKTVKELTQNENGEVTVEYEDIDLPPEVPNVNIVSPNNTITVSSSTNPQTNIKTFEIDVKEKPLSLAWVESGNMTYSPNTGRLYTNVYSLLDLNNWQNPQGDKITYDPNTSTLWLAKGYYTIFSRLEITWEGTPQNKTISVGGNPFDLSFNHKASVGISALHQLSATTAIAITVDVSEQPPQGFSVKVKRADIFSVQQVMENVVQGLQSVTTDDTLTGDGTSENPLSVVVDHELDADSENPVQNKILYGIIGDVEYLLGDL